MTGERVQRKLAAILAGDVVGYSRLMGGDEDGTHSRLKDLLQSVVRPAIAAHSGRLVKLLGDGVLVEFASAVDAVACALQIQARTEEWNAATAEAQPMRLRIGINVGDVIVEDDDIHGDGVNVAARVEALAEAGGICLTRAAVDQVRDKLPIRIENKGKRTVKNIAQPLEVFHVFPGALAGGEAPRRQTADGERPSIAVLAFDNMSSDPEQGFFSDGIAEDIITDLSKISQLHVIARNSSFAYRGSAVSVPQVGAELGVGYVLEGSVRSSGKRVRVTAQLIEAATGGHVWADRFDRDLTDIFEVQDELTREIVEALRVRLSPDDRQRLARRKTPDLEAHTLFLRGREHSFRHTRHDNLEARRILARALEIEPDYAAARARIAFTRVIDYVNDWAEDRGKALAEALAEARAAVSADEADAQAQFAFAIASLWNRDFEAAAAAAARCLDLEPNSAEGHLATAHVQVFGGDPAGAIETLDSYIRLDPLYPDIVLHFLAEAHISLGRYEEAIGALRQRLARAPSSATAYNLIAACCGHLGRLDEARSAWAEARRLEPGYSVEERRRILPFRDPADFERRIEGMRRAGLLDAGGDGRYQAHW